MGTVKTISLTQYNEKMGSIRFPEGFEEQMKKMASEYAGYVDDLSGTDGTIRAYLQECRVANIVCQMRCYGWSDFPNPVSWDDPRLVAETPDPELQRKIRPIIKGRDGIRLIVKENMVVGVVLADAIGYNHSADDEYYYLTEDSCILPYRGYISDLTSDNNGAGYKERDWYSYLICLPYNHNLW